MCWQINATSDVAGSTALSFLATVIKIKLMAGVLRCMLTP